MKKTVVNVTGPSSAEGLRESLENEAGRRGLNLRNFVGDIYGFAVKNKRSFRRPLSNPRRRGGKLIGAQVSDQVANELTNWAKEKNTSRGNLCRYILEMALESNFVDRVFGATE